MSQSDRFGVRDLNAPWYLGVPTFGRAPLVRPDAVPDGAVAIAGAPIDEYATSSARSGMRWGPRRIREASLRQTVYLGTQTDHGLVNLQTGRVTGWPEKMPLVDTGDAPVVHHDAAGQIAALSDHVAAASRTSRVTATLGGDHFVAYPAVDGWVRGWRERKQDLRAGFLLVDSHTDFVDERLLGGRYGHGTCVRRIAEIPEIQRLAFFGINGTSEPEQLRIMKERGFQLFTASYVRRVGPREAMRKVLSYVAEDVDVLYVSLDIDVVNNAHAPATGSFVFEGLSGIEFLEALRELSQCEVVTGVDICEVDPEIDPSWRTELLAAHALFTVFGHHLYEQLEPIPEEELEGVVFK